MPILASTKYANSYGRGMNPPTVTESSYNNTTDAFVVKYDTYGKPIWSARIATGGTDIVNSIITDSSGNVYATGQFAQYASFYNADGTAFKPYVAATANDMFIVKFNSGGSIQWVTRISAATTSNDSGSGIAVDSSGNVYVSGSVTTSPATAYNSDGTAFATTLTIVSGDAVIAKYNSAGFVQWFTYVGGASLQNGYGIAVDSAGSAFLAGRSSGSQPATVYNAGGTTFGTLTNAGSDMAFIVKYDTNGAVQWATRVDSTGAEIGFGTTVDSAGNAYLVGTYAQTATAYNADGSTFGTITSITNGDSYIVKYDTNGVVQWTARVASSGAADRTSAAITDSSNNLYVVGFGAAGTNIVAYNANNGTAGATLTGVSGVDVFVAKYNSSGAVQWANKVGTTGSDSGFGIGIDGSSNVYIAGQAAAGSINIYNVNGTLFSTLAGAGQADGFLVKYNTNGGPVWATRIASANIDTSTALTVDASGNIVVGGSYVGTYFSIYGQTTSLFSSIPNAGGTDAFVAKYNTNGQAQWVSRIASTGSDIAYSTSVDSLLNTYVVGQGGSGATITAYNSDGTAFGTTISNSGLEDTFLVKYNSLGFVQWVARVASTSSDTGRSSCVDLNGNLYIANTSNGAVVTAYNSDNTAFATTVTDVAGDMELVKYNSSGVVQWIAKVSSTGSDIARAITTDSAGNVYIVGSGSNTVVAYNSNGTAFGTTMSVVTAPDMIVVKYSSSGSVLWLARVVSATAGGGSDIGYCVTVDKNDDVYIGGSCNGTSVSAHNSDGTVSSAGMSLGSSVGDAIIVKYSSNGSALWLTRAASSNPDILTGMVSSGDSVILAVQYGGTVSVNNTGGTSYPASYAGGAGGYDILIVNYNLSGISQWVTRVVTTANNVPSGIACDRRGNVYMSGIVGTASAATTITHSDNSIGALFYGTAILIKFDRNGFTKWVQRAGGVSTTTAVATDLNNDVYVSGYSTSGSTVSLYNVDSTPYKFLNSVGNIVNSFLIKYGPNAYPLWGALTTGNNDLSSGPSCATDPSGNVYMMGTSSVVYSFYDAAGNFSRTFTPVGFRDGYIVKYSPTGSILWSARGSGSVSSYMYNDVATDTSGNVYIAGWFATGGALCNPRNADDSLGSVTTNFGGGGNGDATIYKYNSAGIVQWQAQVLADSSDLGYAVTTDSSNNAYLTGTYGTTPGVFNSDGTKFGNLPTAVGSDVFVVKYNTAGIVQWFVTLTSGGADAGWELATDSSNNLFVVGTYIGTLTLRNSNGTSFGTTYVGSAADGFLAKYDSAGFVQWMARITSTGAETTYGTAVAPSGDIYVVGSGGNAIVSVLNADGTTFGTLANLGGGDAYIVKYNTSGVVQWTSRIGTTGGDTAYDVVADSAGNITVVGQSAANLAVNVYNIDDTLFASTVIPGTYLSNEGFMVKYNSSGAVQWVSSVGGVGADSSTAVTTDSTGNIFTVGSMGATSVLVPSRA